MYLLAIQVLKKWMLGMKDNRGITLIALVVTVIVLIILAGISINMISGQNRNFK